ncbi:MAG: DUF1569 domain-containing protein [Phycisphaerae bacterium]|nr:DUF1569 domain-containing protein [Phycisphaerae bacterium]
MPDINTKAVKRRTLRFATIDDALREGERLAEAERAGRLKRLGNWTLGQALNHVATWIDYGYEGYPPRAKPPAIIRFVLRFMKARILKGSMPQGVRIPKVEGGTYGTEVMPTAAALEKFRRSFERLRREPARFHSPAFGVMSEEERVALNLRHAELHLGFFEG